jgi:hypothetical protein
MEAEQVASDVASILADHYTRGETAFFVTHSMHSVLGNALEKQLLKAGFGLFINNEEKPTAALSLTYFLDELEPSSAYRVDIRVEPTYRISFFYLTDNDGALIRSGVTVRDDSHRSVESKKINLNEKKNDAKNKNIIAKTVIIADKKLTPILINKESKEDGVLSTIWAVQLMSLTRSAPIVLEEHKRRIESAGHQAYIVEVDSAKKLRVGPFKSAVIARPVLQEMRANGYPDAFLSGIRANN